MMDKKLMQLIEDYGEASRQYGYWSNFGTAATLGEKRVIALERIKGYLKDAQNNEEEIMWDTYRGF